MGEAIEERVRFDSVRYANCWEDADILLKALEIKAGGTYLSVASAGDNAFSILSCNPSLVIAVDISGAQLACVELRKAAFLNLSYGETLQFLGVRERLDRIGIYTKLAASLSPEARQFWDGHPESLRRGIIHDGKFEGYFGLFRTRVIPLIHRRATVSTLLAKKELSSRIAFYDKRWNTLRWRLLFRIFASRYVMGHLGRDPEFFRYVEGDVASRILKRAEYALTILPTHNNPYLEYILTGNFMHSLPFYLRENNFEAIRKNLGKLVLFKGNVIHALEAHRGLKFDGFNLSDIFEYMSYNDYVANLDRIIKASKGGARLVYWNMLADRKPSEEFRNRLEDLDEFAGELFMMDKAFFYKALRIEQAI